MDIENTQIDINDIDNKISYLSTITAECVEISVHDNSDNEDKTTYLQHEYNEIKGAIDELADKIENIKHLLVMDNTCPNEINYRELITAKIEEINKQKNFMNAFGPYMLLHQIYSNDDNDAQ